MILIQIFLGETAIKNSYLNALACYSLAMIFLSIEKPIQRLAYFFTISSPNSFFG